MPDLDDLPTLLTRDEVAEIFRVAPVTLAKWGRQGKLKRTALSRRVIVYRREDVLALIQGNGTGRAEE